MSIYWQRRVLAIIVIILTSIGTIKVVSSIGDFFTEEFHCNQEVVVQVVSGDTISEIASTQVQSGNCEGYQALTDYLVDTYGASIDTWQRIVIPNK